MSVSSRSALALWILLECLATRATALAEELPVGIVVALPGIDPKASLARARSVGGARWQAERVSPAAPGRPVVADGKLQTALEAYMEADFLGCLAALQRAETQVDRALRTGSEAERKTAGRAAFLSAVCAHGAGDSNLARIWLVRMFVQQLALDRTLTRTRPDFDQLAEEVRSRVVGRARVSLAVTTKPGGALLLVDGKGTACRATPCTVRVLPGEHLITVERLGRGRRTVRRQVTADSRLALALDTLAPAQAKAQLRSALAQRGTNPGTADFVRAATIAYGAQVGVVVWKSEVGVHAVVFDRRREKLYGQVTASGQDAAATALASALQEWRGALSPPFYSRPAFYVPVAAALAAATGVIIYFAVRPGASERELVFR